MSYRGYMMLQEQQGDKIIRREHYRFVISEDWSDGETYAHFCGRFNTLTDADRAIFNNSECDGLVDVLWDSEEEAQRHYKVYADQIWTVTWKPEGDYVRIVIEGYDGAENLIFKRVTVRYTK